MKKFRIISLLLLLACSLTGCGGGSDGPKELALNETMEYSFGTFTINGFKRDPEKFYFSIVIDPINSGSNQLDFNKMYYYTNDSKTKLENINISISGPQYRNVIAIKSNYTSQIEAISLDYDDTEAKWMIDKNLDSDGDITYITTTVLKNEAVKNAEKKQKEEELRESILAEEKAKQQGESEPTQSDTQSQPSSEENQSTEPKTTVGSNNKSPGYQEQKALEKEKSNAFTYGSDAIQDYGDTLYPYGWNFHEYFGLITQEKQDDGSWFFKAECDIKDEEGEKYYGICEAVITGSEKNWTVVSFNIY